LALPVPEHLAVVMKDLVMVLGLVKVPDSVLVKDKVMDLAMGSDLVKVMGLDNLDEC
jgi:hypothetical protein